SRFRFTDGCTLAVSLATKNQPEGGDTLQSLRDGDLIEHHNHGCLHQNVHQFRSLSASRAIVPLRRMLFFGNGPGISCSALTNSSPSWRRTKRIMKTAMTRTADPTEIIAVVDSSTK